MIVFPLFGDQTMPSKSRSIVHLSIFAFVLFCAFVLNGEPAAPDALPTPSLSDPTISPDGKQIAFAAHGDIWTVPIDGGEARLLISNPATESRPVYSPDGKYLAFVSTRTGGGDIYLFTFANGEVRRITFDDAPEVL